MDEVTAAAAVLAVTADDFAEAEMEQEPQHSSSVTVDEQTPALDSMEVVKENEGGNPARSDVEDANPKVYIPPLHTIPKPCAQHLT